MTAQYADLPAEDAAVLREVLDAMASVQLPGDERSIDQRRADALTHLAVDRLNGTISDPLPTRHGRKPAIGVTVALSTLLGLDDQPGELAGHGPIPAALAGRIAADATGTWRRLVTDPCGRLLDYGSSTYRPPTYRPPQHLADYVIARDAVCRAPGCRRQASNCDLDHVIPFSQGGATSAANLLAECRRHHLEKHQTPWTVTGDPNGEITWTDPAGRHYTTYPVEYPIDRTLDAIDDGDGPEPESDAPESEAEPELDPPPF
jgi:5-methylcytosine-specific restriction endonuclease McrA